MIRVLSLSEWSAITPYSTANVTVGNGVNWTQLCPADPTRWCLILSASLGNANVMPGAQPSVANIGLPLGSPTSFPASYFFRATDVGQMVQDPWYGAGTSGTNNVQVTQIFYRPGPLPAGPDEGDLHLCQGMWDWVRRALYRWLPRLRSSWGRARVAAASSYLATLPRDIQLDLLMRSHSIMDPRYPQPPLPFTSTLSMLARGLRAPSGQSLRPLLPWDLLSVCMADLGDSLYG